MELAKVELEAIQNAVQASSNNELVELNQLDLALIGGGSGAVSLG